MRFECSLSSILALCCSCCRAARGEDCREMILADLLRLIAILNLAKVIQSTATVSDIQKNASSPSETQTERESRQLMPMHLGEEIDQLNVTQLLFTRFHYLFQDQLDLTAKHQLQQNESNNTSNEAQALLENRRIEDLVAGQRSSAPASEFQRRNYFKILNRVFSRVDLPQVYKAARPRTGGHCALHIGCVEEIPNFPSILRKANVTSSYTIYTPENPKLGHKIQYEPIVHHQLQDSNTNETSSGVHSANQLQSQLHTLVTALPISTTGTGGQQSRQRQTAVSWRSATKIIYSQEYPFDLASLEQCGFNASLTTRIIVGGYFAKEDEEWIDRVVKQWLLLEPSNIIKVSWADANRGLYHTAAYNSRIVGRQLTLFLHYLDQLFHLNLNRLHLVGHSLGAHIAGFVGADNEGRIARITGLDPAGPIFVELNSSMRLDPSDARFVDVLHTNGGTITKGALGLSTPSGHVDYYCNGGSLQPGCYFSSVTKSIMDPVERVACSHRRSYRYFIEIIELTISKIAADRGESMSQQLSARSSSGALKSHRLQLPRAFLFEAKQEDLVRLVQPELLLMSSNVLRREISALAPLKRNLEFHNLEPDFPTGTRGMYFFRTRSESPFFASRQFALTLKTDVTIRRKMALMAKIDQTVVAEVELDEIPGVYTIAFAPNDPRIVDLDGAELDQSRVPQISLMWRHRSFNLLLGQQNELHLSGLELSLLDADDTDIDSGETGTPPVIRYSFVGNNGGQMLIGSSINVIKSGYNGGGDVTLTRNQWYKFEGRLANGRRVSNGSTF